jgi:hypothetical protein
MVGLLKANKDDKALRCSIGEWGRGEGKFFFGLARLYKPWSIYFYLENLLFITPDIYRHGAFWSDSAQAQLHI